MLITSFLAGAGALVGATVLFAHRREARAAKLYPPMGQDVEVDGIRMHVEVLGPASGAAPDLVLIHGSNGNSRDFTLTLAPALADRYRIFIVDRPGLGWSDMHPDGSSLVTQARLIQGAVDQLGARNPIVLGQSYGGAVALSWAATLPGTLSAVVAVSAATHPWNTGLGMYYSVLSHALGRAILIPLITAFYPRRLIKQEIDKVFAPQPAPAGYAEHFGPELTVRRSSMRTNALQRRALRDEIAALAPQWRNISVPIEAVHGDADPIVSHIIHSKRLAEEHELTELTLLPGQGHMPHHVAENDVVAAIDRAALRANVK